MYNFKQSRVEKTRLSYVKTKKTNQVGTNKVADNHSIMIRSVKGSLRFRVCFEQSLRFFLPASIVRENSWRRISYVFLRIYINLFSSRMSNDAFDGQTLADKLSKLNNSQQSIESLSRWCIVHRKRAKQIVETWDKLFNSSQKEQRVSFLYLANDILQNSRRKGSEFVNEFWKVLPGALKRVYDNGDEQGKKAVTRLVGFFHMCSRLSIVV
ncbi:hypothetical protein LWI28_006301 [Acer negundo]|uniref:CID domain-containing protein n=1 Tax=Acer negundo TaxID=4023 RepID=A0AAD5NVZ6_ACENE|nr:hypothetical protein LWI28_006301 [Acer negundo]